MAKTVKSTDTSIRELNLPFTVTGVAGVGAVTQVPSPISMEEKIGMRLLSAHYYIAAAAGVNPLLADGDEVDMGLSFLAVPPATGFAPWSPGVIDWVGLCRHDAGAATNFLYRKNPTLDTDFTKRDPDGWLAHPANLYYWWWCPNQIGAPTAFNCVLKIFYRTVEITQEVWDDLWKQMFVLQAS